ncbi:MAG: hypothetical protein GM45_0860 [actinobacterium acAMD-5]|nr:MAG: hypothetical protein GM45_0860 [actinobacterium acAMD-5]
MSSVTQAQILVAAPADQVFSVLTDLHSYPTWSSFDEVFVLDRDFAGRATKACFEISRSSFKDSFTISIDYPDKFTMRWELINGVNLKSLHGGYLVKVVDENSSNVQYDVDLTLKNPLLNAMRKSAEKQMVDTALNQLKTKVESKE